MILLHNLIFLYVWILIIAALVTWIPESNTSSALNGVRRALYSVTEPVLRPIRSLMPRPRGGAVALDFSVLVAIVLLEVINSFIH